MYLYFFIYFLFYFVFTSNQSVLFPIALTQPLADGYIGIIGYFHQWTVAAPYWLFYFAFWL